VVTASSSWNLPQSFLADLAYRFVGARPTQGVPAYSELDGRLSRLIGDHFEVAAVGANLLHARHAEFGGAVQIERSVYGEVRCRF
jgi:iron complex outermembrane receptor protein